MQKSEHIRPKEVLSPKRKESPKRRDILNPKRPRSESGGRSPQNSLNEEPISQELVFLFRHGDRLDSHMPSEEEKEKCGGLEIKDDTPLNLSGHQNAKKTG